MRELLPLASAFTKKCTTPSAMSMLGTTAGCAPAAVELALNFGAWWYDSATDGWLLSAHAATMLGVDTVTHCALDDCLTQVIPADLFSLESVLTKMSGVSWSIDHEFRVMTEGKGLRWLRWLSLPQRSEGATSGSVITGVITDITDSKHALIRERISVELTRFLVGTETLSEAVTKAIHLVCENLGWEWGAYWAMNADDCGRQEISCQHFWHEGLGNGLKGRAHELQPSLTAFTRDSCTIKVTPGIGLIGQVWSAGEACWIEDMMSDQAFLRNKSAQKCGLRSGYVFPVVYVSDDGQRHCPGVLEFYSRMSRQREAQLPNLSATIGALIAQTAQRLEHQEAIRLLAETDGLTSLANRHYFYQLLDHACWRARKTDEPVGLMFIDLDRFKLVNDAFGHDAGNRVLREFADRLTAILPPCAVAGRLGGDEFAVMLVGELACSVTDLDALAEAILDIARAPVMFDGHELSVSASIGISVYPENGLTSPELLRSADVAMYRIKKNGRNASSFFSNSTSHTLATQRSDLAQRLTMEAELQQAVENDELRLVYQPIFGNDGQHMYAVEALVRWHRQSGEVVSPDVFIPLAEQTQLIVQIGRWVVEQACADVARLHRAGFDDLQMHVNMAASEFTSAQLPEQLRATVHASGIKCRHLCLELTEGMVMRQPEKSIATMHKLRQLGFGISLDDFGMGYSSLSYLKKLPISSLKIDRSFITGLPHQSDDNAIARTIIELGHHLNLRVIAEGVENDAQLGLLRQYGCTLIQGFVLSRPHTVENLISAFGVVR